MTPTRRAVLVTGHYVRSRRRAGFHFIGDALHRAGWHVTFVTVGFSQLSRLKADHRLAYGLAGRANRLEAIEAGLDSYAWFTPFHPLNRLPSAAGAILGPLFRRYGRLPMPGLRPVIEAADLLVFESTSGLMLEPRFRAWNPRARFVYRVSDDLRLLRAHPSVLRAEARALPAFDLVSVPSRRILEVLGGGPNVALHLHGIDTAAFDAPSPDPYCGPRREARAVFVGAAYLDTAFVELAARELPGWDFHYIGPLGPVPAAPNVTAHGELPFAATVPYITHADVGLATLRELPGAESFSDSLKIIQYTWARLPIVAPAFLRSPRTNVFPYVPGDGASIRRALLDARAWDRSLVDRSGIGSWDDLARALAGPVAAEPAG